MAGLFTHLLEGENLNQFNKFAQDGDVRHLGNVGRNLTLINIHERAVAEQAMLNAVAEAERRVERRAAEAEAAAIRDQGYYERLAEDRARAMARSAENVNRGPVRADSEEGVDNFIKNLV